jgi:LysM repeat protein
MVAPMRAFFTVFLTSLGLLVSAARADEATMQADIDQMKGAIEALTLSNADLQKRLSEANREIRDLRDDLSKASPKAALEEIKDQQRNLASKIEEVDKKRLNDAELVREQLEKIAKLVANAPIASSSRNDNPKPDHGSDTPPPSGEMYPYTIVSGDTISAIVDSFNAEFKRKGMKTVSVSQVMAANPGLDPKRLFVGKKIFVPAPQ